MKFTGSVIGKIFLVIICLILGIVLGLGGLVGGVYFALTKMTVAQLEEKVEPSLPESVKLEFDEATKAKTLLAWGKDIVALVGKTDTATIGEIEGTIGVNIISKTMFDTVGVDPAEIKNSTISNIGETIGNSLTIEKVTEKFGIGLPDMPVFKDEAFLASPLSTAFEGLTEYPLNKFVVIDETDGNEVLKAIQDLKISEIGGAKLTEKVNGLKLSQVIKITEGESNSVLVSLKDTTIGELGGKEADQIVKSLFVGEVMTINESSEPILKKLKYSSVESVVALCDKETFDQTNHDFSTKSEYATAYAKAHTLQKEGYQYIYGAFDPEKNTAPAYVHKMKDGVPEIVTVDENGVTKEKYVCYKTKQAGKGAEEKNYPLIGFNDQIATITFGDVVHIDSDPAKNSPLINSIKGTAIVDMGKTIDTLFLKEMIEINAESAPVLKAIQYATLSDKTLEILKTDVVAPGAEQIAKQLPEYNYKYTQNAKGELVPYVWKADNADKFVVYETKEVDGKYYPIIGISTKLNVMTISDIFKEEDLNSGILSLIPSTTKIEDIGKEVQKQMTSSALATLSGIKVLESFDMGDMKKEQQAFIWNSNLNDMINGLLKFVNNPISGVELVPDAEDPLHNPPKPQVNMNYGPISPEKVEISSANFASLTEFVNAYQGKKLPILNLGQNVVVTVNPAQDSKYMNANGDYIIPAFSLNGAGFTLTFAGLDTGKTVALAQYEIEANMFTKLATHQYFYVFDASNQAQSGGVGSDLKYFDGANFQSGTARVTGAGTLAEEKFIAFRNGEVK